MSNDPKSTFTPAPLKKHVPPEPLMVKPTPTPIAKPSLQPPPVARVTPPVLPVEVPPPAVVHTMEALQSHVDKLQAQLASLKGGGRAPLTPTAMEQIMKHLKRALEVFDRS